MPLLKRKEFEKITPPEVLRDDEDVFFCEETKEIFRNYDDYFARIMMINSMVWSCSMTGKPNLTYAEAAESEKNARKSLSAFPRILKGPILLVASLTKRSAFGDLVEDVLGFIKDRYFKNEKLDVLTEDEKNYVECEIIEVLSNTNAPTTSPVKVDSISYRVKNIHNNKTWLTTHDKFRRDRIKCSREKNKLFLKQHLEQVNGMLKIKDSSYKKYVTDAGLKFDEIFVSKPPDFQLSKRLFNKEEKQKNERKSTSRPSDTKKKSNKKDNKQPSISNYLNKSDPGMTTNKVDDKKKQENEKRLIDELERMRLQREKQLADEKALNEEIKNTVFNMNQPRDDLELQDSKKIPIPKPVNALIGNKYFGDFVEILEFMNTFSDILSIQDKFPNGVTMELLERALLVREVNGPLTDILQVLLSTIFSLQIEEENEVEIKYETNSETVKKKDYLEVLQSASRTQLWCTQHYSMNLNELVMDCTTISELLRLHILSSGAIIDDKGARWRFNNRGGYVNSDDPGLLLRQQYPHILRALQIYSVYQLPMSDVMKIVKCLMNQILTYSSVRDVIEDRLNRSAAAKIQYNHLNQNEKRRENKVLESKKVLKTQSLVDIQTFSADQKKPMVDKLNHKTEIESNLENDINKIDSASEKEKKLFLGEIEKCKSEFFAYQIYLGSDRAHRNYWLFESLPGLFVEHSFLNTGKCNENCVEYIPGLVNCPKDQRSKFIRQMIISKKANNDKENNNKNIQPSNNGKGLVANGASVDEPSNTFEKDAQQLAKELFMCTANDNCCPVHTENYPERVTWSYFHTPEEINQLIESLNVRGFRERALLQTLEIEKDLILDHISNCPVNKLNVSVEKKDEKLQEIIQNGHKKYNQLNFSGKDVNITLDANFRDNILELEYKLSVGYLGNINVTDHEKWRKTIENFSYSKECESLSWGVDKKKKDGTEDLRSNDPGHDLGNTLEVESEDSSDEGISLHDSPTLKENVVSLASALLQIEQGIERKFLRAPFGPKREIRDKTLMAKMFSEGSKKLSFWEESLMRCTSYAQLFLHYNILSDAIIWSRSALKMNCMICRKKENPEKTLLCDDCNRGCHIYCLKPKLTKIPVGDWFCARCKPEFHIKEKVTRKRKIFTVSESESSEAESDDEKPASVSSRSESDANVEICKVCNLGGELVHCASTKCRTKCHLKCAKPPLRKMPARKEQWYCTQCAKKNGEDSKKRKFIPEDEEESEEEIVESKNNKKTQNRIKLQNGYLKKKQNIVEEVEEEEDDEEAEEDNEVEDEEEDIADESEEQSEEEDNEEEDEGRIRTRRSINKIKIMNGNHKNKIVADEESEEEDESAESEEVEDESDDDLPRKRKRRAVIKYGFSKTEKKSSNNRRSSRKSEPRRNSRYTDDPPVKSKRSLDVANGNSRRSKRSSDDFPLHSVLLYALLDDIMKHKESWPFNRPVSQKEVPDYYKIIKTPMDFAKIKSKLNCGEYKTDEEIMLDIQLVFKNCDLYNTNSTDIYRAGIKLEKFVDDKCKELNLPFKPSDMIAESNSASPTNSRKKKKLNN